MERQYKTDGAKSKSDGAIIAFSVASECMHVESINAKRSIIFFTFSQILQIAAFKRKFLGSNVNFWVQT